VTLPDNQQKPLTESGKLRQRVSILQRQAQQLSRILEINRQLTSTLELEPLLEEIIHSATELTDTEAASIMLYDDKLGELRFAAVTGINAEQLAKMRVPIEGSIAGAVWKTGQPMQVTQADQDPRHYDATDQAIHFQTRNILGVPLSIKERNIGVLEALNKHGDAPFTEEDTQVLSTLAAQAAVAIHNAQLVGALQRAYHKLNQLDSLKSDFIAIASHELRTPLGLILGYASILKDDASGPAAEQLEVVMQAALRLRGLIEEMVNLRHLDTGERVLQRATFPIQDLIKTVCTECESLATAKGQTISFNLPAAPAPVSADRAQITIVLNNLLTNAIKFTPQGGRIAVSVEPRNNEVCVSVSDTGIGIAASDLERIFERFYQVEPHMNRRHGGMGLGLSISKGLVELHGGRIWAESVKGRGSRFTFTLPANNPNLKTTGGTGALPSLARLAF
jgi:signal transduction histidine kinase